MKKIHPTEAHAILKLNKERYSVTKIVKIVDRSGKVTINLLKEFDNCGKIKSRERSLRLIVRDKRANTYTVKSQLDTRDKLQKKLDLSNSFLLFLFIVFHEICFHFDSPNTYYYISI